MENNANIIILIKALLTEVNRTRSVNLNTVLYAIACEYPETVVKAIQFAAYGYEWDESTRRVILESGRIAGIKHFREVSQWGLKDSKEWVDANCEYEVSTQREQVQKTEPSDPISILRACQTVYDSYPYHEVGLSAAKVHYGCSDKS